MKFIHTADWHLGRYLHGISLLEDQAHILEQFVALARSQKVDAVVIAGDVYDRAVPPAEAVALLDKVLAQLVVESGITVILIAGNHDSADRLAFGGRIFEKQGLFVRGTLEELTPVVLQDAHGEVAFHPLPFVEPIFARALEGGAEVTDHQSAMTHALSLLRGQRREGQRNVLVGHAFVAGGSVSDSERPLSVGGLGMVATDSFEGFDFVALGHLHRPQNVGSDHIHYSGSLLKYSFNEVDHVKSVSLVEIGADGRPTVSRQSLIPRRDLRIIKGTLSELLANPDPKFDPADYLCAHLTDSGPLLDPMVRLRAVYPNMLELALAKSAVADATAGLGGDHRNMEPTDIFRAFYRDVLNEEIDDDALEFFNQTVQSLPKDGGIAA